MLLTQVTVTNFKSIDNSGEVPVDENVTVLVGKNEAGKTAFLQALNKANSIDKDEKYNIVDDYPRRHMTEYEDVHETEPATVTKLTYRLESEDTDAINESYGFPLLKELSFGVFYNYQNTRSISLSLAEQGFLDHLRAEAPFTDVTKHATTSANTVRVFLKGLEEVASKLDEEESAFLTNLQNRFADALTSDWANVLGYELWQKHLKARIPKFVYFDDYYLLPGKINIAQLQHRLANGGLQSEDKTALSLLRLARVELETLTKTTGYEQAKARLEAISNSITDRIFKYWTQNQSLNVLIDIGQDSTDDSPYNNGNNIYIRVNNQRHRFSGPFSQRSRGFIWFFSFLVWFDSIKKEYDDKDDLLLLLDEPGLNLHALGQEDLLNYVDDLAKQHQVIYTTHSPFMVRNDRLHQVRMVEDRDTDGTKISANLSGSDPSTLFPLQAALGYSIAQNLFISKRNLLVEGPADLIYLQFFSALLGRLGRTTFRDDVTIVPTGGLDKLATFVALLRGNKLDMVVLHDETGTPDARLEHLVREKILQQRLVLTYGLYRDPAKPVKNIAPGVQPTDVEDLIDPAIYLHLFNTVYNKELPGPITVSDLPAGDRIIHQISGYLKSKKIQLRSIGGFNHYLPANYLAANPLPDNAFDADTLQRFENLFKGINTLYKGK